MAISKIDPIYAAVPVTYVQMLFYRMKSEAVHRICEIIRKDAIEQGRFSKEKHQFCQKRSEEIRASALIMECLIHLRQLPLN